MAASLLFTLFIVALSKVTSYPVYSGYLPACCVGSNQPPCCSSLNLPNCCSSYPSYGFPGTGLQLFNTSLSGTGVGMGISGKQAVVIDNSAASIGQQNVLLHGYGSHQVPHASHGLPLNYQLPPMFPGYSKTYHYQYIPQAPVVHHHQMPVYFPRPLPTLPPWKPFTFPPLPTAAPWIPLTSRVGTPAPLKYTWFKPPTMAPLKVPVFPTIPPPRYGYIAVPTLPPMKVLLPPEIPALRYAEIPWPTFAPLRVPIFPTPAPLKYKDVHWPTFAPWRIAVVDHSATKNETVVVDPIAARSKNQTSTEEPDCVEATV